MQTDKPEPQPQEPIDPHSSKIPADDPRLQLPKKKSRTLKKGPVVAISATLTGMIAAALVLALQPQHKSTEQDGKTGETEAVAQPTIPDVVRQAPDERSPVSIPDTSITASVPDDVPQLGRPLPGDLGHAMVHSPNGYRAGTMQSAPPDPAEQERLAAIASSPFFGGASTPISTPASGGIAGLQASAPPAPGTAPYGRDQNNQARKNDFFESVGGDGKEYLSKSVRKPVSRYEVKAGAIIPAILVTGLNSDLPGNVIAMVKENVYDTVTGEYLLVPQGTRVLGLYDSMVSYGQKRVQVVWVRMIRPDGSSITLENMPGVDLAGMSGYKDKVDNHFDRLVGGALLSSILSVGATVSQGTYTNDQNMTTQQRMAASLGQDINNAGQQITRKNLDIQPTLKIRAGMTVNILVNKDMIVDPYKN
ncbi:MAG TPA: TrbI/VirB10 family protein [Chlorobaculum parvum]|uniref:TrbI/VirB10 family protein n=1 Tax=Chlorobaculum parvum TaxID=274539 RepID=A0A7C5HG49_9CHLB|nr:TrbI/VirB10 family protein [Chlorobaculum parvum]